MKTETYQTTSTVLRVWKTKHHYRAKISYLFKCDAGETDDTRIYSAENIDELCAQIRAHWARLQWGKDPSNEVRKRFAARLNRNDQELLRYYAKTLAEELRNDFRGPHT